MPPGIPPSRWLEQVAKLAASQEIAIVDAEGSATFAAVTQRARQLAGQLSQRGVQGRRVALLAPADREWVEGFWGILLAGATVVPLSPLHPAPEQSALLQQSGAAAWLLADSMATTNAVDHPRRWRYAAGRLLDPASPPLGVGEAPGMGDADEATALLLFTSGTTGKPKGVPLSHRNVQAGIETLIAAWGISPRDRLIHCLPLHHLHGICVSLLSAFCAGASTHLLPSYSPAGVLAAAEHASVLMGVPTQHKRLLDYLETLDAAERVGHSSALHGLRLITSGSAKLPEQVGHGLQRWSGQYPLERYGMTEVGIVLSNPLASPRLPGSSGQPLPGCEIRIVDEAGDTVRAGDAGEIWIRAPSVFAGYDQDRDATAAAFRDGFFKSGDTGRWTPDGFVQILGRTSVDIIKSGGYKLSAIELEEHLRAHPWVRDVAVVGVPDADWGERAVAVVVPSAAMRGATSGAAALDDETAASRRLQQWMKQRVAGYQVPRSIIWRGELPRNALGKVQKTELLRLLTRLS